MSELQASAAPMMTVRVLCEKDHLLCGLFIVLRLKPSTGDDRWADVARVIEQTKDPGPEPQAPAPTGKKKKDAAAHKKWEDAHKAWADKLAASRETPPDPSQGFVAAFVDDDGYLVPVKPERNPWREAATKRDPDCYKLGLGEVYETYWVRHPDPELARAVARALNNRPDPGDERYEITGLVKKELTVEAVAVKGGMQYFFKKLSESAADYFPPGPKEYGGWSLYLDMPHALCDDMPKQVEKLQNNLSTLRYPTGKPHPFEFEESGKLKLRKLLLTPELEKRISAEKVSDRLISGVFHFDPAVAAAVVSFQERVRERKAFKLSHPDEVKHHHWGYLLGSEVRLDPSWEPRAHDYLGIVDAHTGRMIDKWIENDLIRPGAEGTTMIESTQVGVWMQARAAIALDAWSLLLEALGVQYDGKHGKHTLASGYSWDDFVKTLGYHHMGLAVDFTGGPTRHTKPNFPARFEGEYELRPKGDKVSDEDAYGNLNYRLRFLLYCHSRFDPFHREQDVAEIKRNLAAFATSAPARIKAHAFGKTTSAEADAYIERVLAPAVAYANELAALSGKQLCDRLFRETVYQFIANPNEADGGSPKLQHPTDAIPPDFERVAWAKSFVNATVIAYRLNLVRISAHGSIHDVTYLQGSAPLAGYPMQKFLARGDDDTDLPELLRMVAVPTSEAPENRHYDQPIPIKEEARSADTFAYVRPRDLDRGFLRDWSRYLAGVPKPFKPSPAGRSGLDRTRASGAQLQVVLSMDPKKTADVAPVIAKLEGDFKSQRFLVTHAGEHFVVPTDRLVTGAELAAAVRAGDTAFRGEVKARWEAEQEQRRLQKARKDGGAKPVVTRRQADHGGGDKRASSSADWTIVIQPVLVTGEADPRRLPFLPTHWVYLPPTDKEGAAGLEWWHYQYHQEDTMGELGDALGHSLKVLAVDRIGPDGGRPEIHRGAGYPSKVGATRSSNTHQPGNVYSPPKERHR